MYETLEGPGNPQGPEQLGIVPTYVHTHTIPSLKTIHLSYTRSPICPPYQGEQTRTLILKPIFPLFFYLISRQGPQVPSGGHLRRRLKGRAAKATLRCMSHSGVYGSGHKTRHDKLLSHLLWVKRAKSPPPIISTCR